MQFDRRIPQSKTEWNSSQASLERLDELLKDSNKLSRLCYVAPSNKEKVFYLKNWKYNIFAILRELSPKIKKDGKMDSFEDHETRIEAIKDVVVIRKVEGGNIAAVNMGSFNKLWQLLHKFEMQLRAYADAKGMLMTESRTTFGEGL